MSNFKTRDDFIKALELLKQNLNNEEYSYVTGIMRSLKYCSYKGYDAGYDPLFDSDIFRIKHKNRENNLYAIHKNIKLCTKPL